MSAMKLLHTITSLAICSLSFAFGEEQPELAEVEVVPVPQDEIICEFPGRVFKPETEAIPKGYADEKAIAIKLESLVRNKGACRPSPTCGRNSLRVSLGPQC